METTITKDTSQYVVFSINHQLFSLSVEEVVEILRVPIITDVPGIDESIKGVINLRGNILPVVSLHSRFALTNTEQTKKSRVVIVQGDNENIGIMVDEVKMVTRFQETNIEPPPGIQMDRDTFTGFAKLDQKVIGILNLAKILYEQEE